MSQLFISLVAFVIALGILVAIHEFGHFWVARRLGVKVLRFSLGFGKVIWRYQGTETEYVISALPLGGYVKMLGEQDDDVAEHERHRAFNVQPVWKRIAIVSAGPLFNFMLAAVLYTLVFIVGIPGTRPMVGEVEPGSYAASAGFEQGDLIVAVDSLPVTAWQDVRLLLLEKVLAVRDVSLQVISETGVKVDRVLSFSGNELLKQEGEILENIGLLPWQPVLAPVIAEVQPGGAAARYGLQPGDRVSIADGQVITTWMEWVNYVRSRPDKEIQLTVVRNGNPIQMDLVPASKQENDQSVGFIGAGVELKQADAEWEKLRVLVRYPVAEAVSRGLAKTWDMTLLSFRMIGKLVTGDASSKNISGPITIAEYAGKTFSIDIRFFLDFLAIISIGLAVLNILPIPMLDGGHLLYYVIELLTGRPLPEKIQLMGQNIGIFLLACLMSLAFYNDIVRLMG